MSINPTTGNITPKVCVSRRQSTKPTVLQKPINGDIPACATYAHNAVQHSSKPFRTSAFIWVRFLRASYLQADTTTANRAGVSQ